MKRNLLKPASLFTMAIVGAGAMVFSPAKAHAIGGLPPIDVYVSSVTVNAPTSGVLTGYLDVYAAETSVPFPINVTNFAASLTIDSTAGASLIGADDNGSLYPNLFDSTHFSSSVVSTSDVLASNSSAETTIGSDAMELLRIEFQITPSASGDYNVTLDALTSGIFDNSTSYPLTIHPGTITVIGNVGNPTVPEPASLSLLAAGTAGLMIRRRRSV